jgi:beta-phosphoglucomutase-like phosphatase (HAD superfamily)
MIDTLVFDFDGVILDTESPDYQTWHEVFESYGVALELPVWTQHIGGRSGRFDWHRHLEELTGVSIHRESTQLERRHRYLELIHASPVLPGILDYLQDAKGLGLRLGVASSSSLKSNPTRNYTWRRCPIWVLNRNAPWPLRTQPTA